jgi:hypothetical protein
LPAKDDTGGISGGPFLAMLPPEEGEIWAPNLTMKLVGIVVNFIESETPVITRGPKISSVLRVIRKRENK